MTDEEPPKIMLITEAMRSEGYRTISPPDRIPFTVLVRHADGTFTVVNPEYENWKRRGYDRRRSN